MNHAVDLIASGLPAENFGEVPAHGVCCVTGCETLTVAREIGIKTSFTNLDLLKAPESKRIGLAAATVLNHRPARSCWMAQPGCFTELKGKKEIRDAVFSPPPGPFCGYATTSYKKHGALRCPVNNGTSNRWLFESVVADCSNRERLMSLWSALRAAQDHGVPRPVLENHDAGPALINKLGFTWWSTFLATFGHLKTDPLYQFLVYLLPSQEELKSCATK